MIRAVFYCTVLFATAIFFITSDRASAQNVSASAFATDSSWNNDYSTGRKLFMEKCSPCHLESALSWMPRQKPLISKTAEYCE